MGSKDIPPQKAPPTCGKLKTCCDVYSADNAMYSGCIADAYLDCCEDESSANESSCCTFMIDDDVIFLFSIIIYLEYLFGGKTNTLCIFCFKYLKMRNDFCKYLKMRNNF